MRSYHVYHANVSHQCSTLKICISRVCVFVCYHEKYWTMYNACNTMIIWLSQPSTYICSLFFDSHSKLSRQWLLILRSSLLPLLLRLLSLFFTREGQKHECEWCLGANVYPYQHTYTSNMMSAFFWTSSLCVRSLHGVHTWTRLWIYAHVYMWSICVFVFATLFNITNMRTHCVRVHNTYMWTL